MGTGERVGCGEGVRERDKYKERGRGRERERERGRYKTEEVGKRASEVHGRKREEIK